VHASLLAARRQGEDACAKRRCSSRWDSVDVVVRGCVSHARWWAAAPRKRAGAQLP
jgi:hypothetical protein